MACFLLTLPSSLCLPTPRPSIIKSPQLPPPLPICFSTHPFRSKTRGSTFLTRAALSANVLTLAVGLPLSLLGFTTVVTLYYADRIEKEYLEEYRINKAIEEAMEANDDEYEDDDDDDDSDDTNDSFLEEKELEPELPRTRNRPKRGA